MAQQFPTWVTAPGPVLRELLRYQEPALLAVALACLAALIIIRVRRRRAARRDSGLSAPEAGTARGRHAVGGPAGSGEVRTARPDFSHLAVTRGGDPDPAGGRGHGTRRPAGRAVDEPGLGDPSPDSPIGGHAPLEETPAENGAPAGGALPGTLRAWGLERGDDGIRAAPAGPPWAPAEKPPAESRWAEDGDEDPPRPGGGTDVQPPWPDGG